MTAVVAVLAAVIGFTVAQLIDRSAPNPCRAAVEYVTSPDPVVPNGVAERNYITNVTRCLGR